MSYANGAIAVNETGFVSRFCPAILELGGENGRIYAEGSGCIKVASEATGGKLVDVEPCETGLHPLRQFIRGCVQEGIGMEDAIKLTRLMEMAYNR